MTKCKVIALANQKGGTAKTTTTLNLEVFNSQRERYIIIKAILIQCCKSLTQHWKNTISFINHPWLNGFWSGEGKKVSILILDCFAFRCVLVVYHTSPLTKFTAPAISSAFGCPLAMPPTSLNGPKVSKPQEPRTVEPFCWIASVIFFVQLSRFAP